MKGAFHCRRWGCETTKGKMNVYPSHSGTFMQVQETYVKVATRLFNSRRTNVTPCLLLETKACVNSWVYGVRGKNGKTGSSLCFPSFILLIPELQKTYSPGLSWPHHGSVYLMADFAVPGTSFPICYHFVTHTLTLFPFLCFPWEYTMNKNLLVLKLSSWLIFKAPSSDCYFHLLGLGLRSHEKNH